MRSTRPVPLTVESIPSLTWLQLNAGAHLLPEAGATQERTLFGVGSSVWFGADLASKDRQVS